MQDCGAGLEEIGNDFSLESSSLLDHEIFFSIMKRRSVVVGIETSSL